MDEPDVATGAQAFGAVADDYERARPGYPAEVVTLTGIAGARVCDLAAGTGKLTRVLVAAGCDVVAVEPVAGMRERLAVELPAVDVRLGTAEAIPLPDGDVDAVTVAQAFHWFRSAEALAEIVRVLRPGGTLAVVFNERDATEGWVAAMNAALRWNERTIATAQHADWSAVVGAAGYRPARYEALRWAQPMTRELLAARVRSVSYVAAASAADRQRYLDAVGAVVADLSEPFALPYVTHVWWTTTPG